MLDFIEITFVVVPIVGPILLGMGIDPIWLGVLIAVNLQTSFLTPPFGFALFYLRGVTPENVSTGDIYRGVGPFVILQLLLLGAACCSGRLWPPGCRNDCTAETSTQEQMTMTQRTILTDLKLWDGLSNRLDADTLILHGRVRSRASCDKTALSAAEVAGGSIHGRHDRTYPA